MSSSPLAKLTKGIIGDGAARDLAVRAITDRVDWIFGYAKYDPEEIAGELRYRLHCMEYLGVAVQAIVESDTVSEEFKVTLAREYLRTLPLYVEGRLPKDVYTTWEDMEPTCPVEAAVFLQERDLFEWSDHGIIRCVLQFALDSGVEAKRTFLSNLVARLNEDEGLLRKLSTRPLWHDEVAEDLEMLASRERHHDIYGLGGVSETGRRLLVNLRPLIDADDSGSSSFGPIANLNALSDQDLVKFFLGVGGMFYVMKRMNRVAMFRDLAESMLVARGIGPLDLLKRLDQRTDRDRFFYDDEARTKGLLKLAQARGEATREFAEIVKKFLDYKMETDTRFQLFRFAYENSGDKDLLERASKFKSAKIRDWAARERSWKAGP